MTTRDLALIACLVLPYAAITIADMRQQRRRRARERFEREFVAVRAAGGTIQEEILVSAVQIDKNIPMPDRLPGNAGNGRWSKYPFAEMEVGDSFLVTDTPRNKISSAANQAYKRLGFKFKTGKVDDGIRVWRIA